MVPVVVCLWLLLNSGCGSVAVAGGSGCDLVVVVPSVASALVAVRLWAVEAGLVGVGRAELLVASSYGSRRFEWAETVWFCATSICIYGICMLAYMSIGAYVSKNPVYRHSYIYNAI